jgi:ribosome maturation factor RimP
MPAATERLLRLVEPIVTEAGAELFDVERTGGRLVVTIDRAGGGLDIDTITAVTRALSRALDEDEPIEGHYVLEVTSPGIERPLRNARQYRWAVGKQITVRVASPESTEASERRCTGTLLAADDDGIDLELDEPAGEVIHVAYASIQRGRTVVDWDAAMKSGPKPKPKPSPESKPGAARRDPPKGAHNKRVSNR